MQITSLYDGTTYDTDQLHKDCGEIEHEGKQIWLTKQANLDANPLDLSESIYAATGIDADGHAYRVRWEITTPDCEDESDACDWDTPYLVERFTA